MCCGTVKDGYAKKGAKVNKGNEKAMLNIPSWVGRVLVGEPFWNLWGGLVFHTMIMAAVVSWSLQLFDNSVREFVDTNVQSTLLRRMAEAEYAPANCDTTSLDALVRCIAIVAIDDADFRGAFQQQSPLNPDVLRKFFDSLLASPPRVVAIDLDLSPAAITDWPARESLLASLLALSKVTRLVMVCPQGYSTPEPGPLDKAWVQRFDENVQFASADLNVDGLYYNKELSLPTLGVATARAAVQTVEKQAALKEGAVDWHTKCLAPSLKDVRKPKLAVIRPTAVAVKSFMQAEAQPTFLANHVVLVGGKWGVTDQFKLRGQSDAFFGVNLHAWVTATELVPPEEPTKAAVLVMELVIGLVAGALFRFIWQGVMLNRHDFAFRSSYYLLFFLLAFGLPLFWVMVASHLAKFGLLLGAAGMVLGAAADSVLSSHEALLEKAQKEEGKSKDALKRGGNAALLKAQIVAFKSAWPALLLAAVLFAMVFYGGHSFWICLSCGAVGGIALGTMDRVAGPREYSSVPKKVSTADLLARFMWTVLKALALLWFLNEDRHATTTALLLGFLLFWCGAYWCVRATFRQTRRSSKK